MLTNYDDRLIRSTAKIPAIERMSRKPEKKITSIEIFQRQNIVNKVANKNYSHYDYCSLDLGRNKPGRIAS
jgi:hypothetical protein